MSNIISYLYTFSNATDLLFSKYYKIFLLEQKNFEKNIIEYLINPTFDKTKLSKKQGRMLMKNYINYICLKYSDDNSTLFDIESKIIYEQIKFDIYNYILIPLKNLRIEQNEFIKLFNKEELTDDFENSLFLNNDFIDIFNNNELFDNFLESNNLI